MSAARLKESLEASDKYGLPKYQVFQPEYNLYNRQKFEEVVSQVCQAKGLGVISYFSLASGFLTGKYRKESDFDKSVRGDSMGKYLNERGKRILDALDKLSAENNASPAGVALAWLINSPLVSAPIASITKSKHLAAFQEAVQMDLTVEDIEVLNEASGY